MVDDYVIILKTTISAPALSADDLPQDSAERRWLRLPGTTGEDVEQTSRAKFQ